jgi:hypothetical protein
MKMIVQEPTKLAQMEDKPEQGSINMELSQQNTQFCSLLKFRTSGCLYINTMVLEPLDVMNGKLQLDR